MIRSYRSIPGLRVGFRAGCCSLLATKPASIRLATLRYRVLLAHLTDKISMGPDKCLANSSAKRAPEGSSVAVLGETRFGSSSVILDLQYRRFGVRLIRKDFAILRELA